MWESGAPPARREYDVEETVADRPDRRSESDADSRMFMYDPDEVRSIEQILSDEGIVPASELPPGVYVSKYKSTKQRPLNRARRVNIALGMKQALNTGTRPIQSADALADTGMLQAHEARLQFLRQIQTLIDETDARIALRKMQDRENWWRDDEAPIRGAVNSWRDELPEKDKSIRFTYRTPKPQSIKLDKYEAILRNMGETWEQVDLDLQMRGYRPERDKNAHDRTRGTKADEKRRQLGAGGIAAALKNAMPEVFGGPSRIRPDAKPTKSAKLSAKIDPFEEAMFSMMKHREDAVRAESKRFEGMSRKRQLD